MTPQQLQIQARQQLQNLAQQHGGLNRIPMATIEQLPLATRQIFAQTQQRQQAAMQAQHQAQQQAQQGQGS